MRKRLIAGILTAVMIISSLQLQTVSVTAQEMYQETEETSLAMEDADTETRKQDGENAVEDAETESGMESGTGTQGESAVEDTDSEAEAGKQEDETDNEDSKENETDDETEGESQENEEESAATEGADGESEGAEKEVNVENETDDETEGESQENGEESAVTEDEEAEPETAQEETDVEDTEEENIEEHSEDETEIEAAGAEMVLETSDSDIASGQYKNVSWVIDANGKLTVEGTGEFGINYDHDSSYYLSRMPWSSYRNSIVSAEINLTDTTDAGYMFWACQNLTSVDLSGFDTSNVTNMMYMFGDCRSLTSIDLSGFNTSNVTDMQSMFSDCRSLTSIDLSGLDTGNVTNMGDMFGNCFSLTSINLSGLDTSNVTEMGMMFSWCRSLTSIDVSGLNTSNVINMNEMFYLCESLTSLDLSGFDTSKVTDMSGMFRSCHFMTSLDLSGLDIGNVTSASDMFNEDNYLTTIYTPCNLSISIELPGSIWYSCDGTELTELPQGLSYSIIIMKNKIPTAYTVSFKNDDGNGNVYTYTGAAVKPEIKVTYNKKDLIPGTDYTIKYSNNIKVGTAKITVTGKGNFAGSSSGTTFEIVEKDIEDADVTLCGVTTDADNKETLTLANGATLTPVLYYNNIKLTNKDYVIKDANGTEISGKKLGDSDNNTTIKIEGKDGGNFTGSREVTLNVVEKKNLTKFTVAVDKTKLNTLLYDGNPHYIHEINGAITVTAKNADKANMEYGKDYTIVYPSDVTSAGTKKFTVVGRGIYTGNISKFYTIKPAKEAALSIKYDGSIVAGDKISTPFTFASSGITFGSKLTVTDGNGNALSEGKDYKVSYSGNKQVGTKAKCTITFLGNYKGHSKQIVGFEIVKADLSGTEVVIADQVYKGKEGIYKSVPYVIEDKRGANVLVKASNYKTTYYTEDPTNNESAAQMKGKNKVKSGDTVWVKLEAKGKNYSGSRVVSYKVREAQDLSKAKITFKDTDGNAIKKMPYTGNKISDNHIKAVVDGVLAENIDGIEVIYVNNINKGKATVIVKGTDTDSCVYAGCKTATFSIVARSFSLN